MILNRASSNHWKKYHKKNKIKKKKKWKDILKKRGLQSFHYVSLNLKKPFPELSWLKSQVSFHFYSPEEAEWRLIQVSNVTTKQTSPSSLPSAFECLNPRHTLHWSNLIFSRTTSSTLLFYILLTPLLGQIGKKNIVHWSSLSNYCINKLNVRQPPEKTGVKNWKRHVFIKYPCSIFKNVASFWYYLAICNWTLGNRNLVNRIPNQYSF